MWTFQTRLLAIMATLILLAGSAWYGHSKGRQSGMLQVQSQWDAERAATAAAQAAEIQKARSREQALQATADRLKKEKDDEIRARDSRIAALLDSLHNRPDSPTGSSGTGLPEVAGTGPATGWCDGSRLYRDHAAVLVGEAAMAAELQAYARYCVQQYEAVRVNSSTH